MRSAILCVAFIGCAKTTPIAVPVPTSGDEQCQVVADGRTVCFSVGNVCTDPHGIGDGVPIVVDCWNSGGRMCHPGSDEWPVCAGGVVR
ncbi:MAG: hypothetical protein ACJAZO_004259 [Myxococcota bacterium]|jgi:hypothetical protein